MFTVTISTTPGQPGHVFGRIGLHGSGLSRDCLFVYLGWLNLVTVLRLDCYALGVEPIVGLLARLLMRIPDRDLPRSDEPTSFVSVSVYQGWRLEPEMLREHLVATTNGVLLNVEYADEDRDRRTVGAAHPYSSPVMMVGHAICTLLWAGGTPTPLLPLDKVRKHRNCALRVLAHEITPYTRRLFVRHLGAFRGPTPEAFNASDWEEFLRAVAR